MYGAVFNEYMKQLLVDGHSVEFFLEGTRSRSNKMVTPRFGLLKAALEPYFEGRVPDMQLVPISLDYEKTLEGTIYAEELLGIPKPKESLANLLSLGAAKTLAQGHGKVSARFGAPVSLRATIATMAAERASASTSAPAFDPAASAGDRSALIRRVAFVVLGEQLANCSCMPTHLVAALLLHRRRRSTSVAALVDQVSVLLCTVTFYANLAHSLTRSP